MRPSKIIGDCIELFCVVFTIGILFTYFWKGEANLELSSIIAGSLVAGRLLRLAFTGRPVMPAEKANG